MVSIDVCCIEIVDIVVYIPVSKLFNLFNDERNIAYRAVSDNSMESSGFIEIFISLPIIIFDIF